MQIGLMPMGLEDSFTPFNDSNVPAFVRPHFSLLGNADNEDSANLRRPGKPVLVDHAAGTGGDCDPSIAGVNLAYPRLKLGALGIAPWQQWRWITYEDCPRMWARAD